jgi:DNA-binding transcriptional MerR regulator
MSERTIKWLAGSAGVAESTVRYYERKHILAPARRTHSGYRQYTDSDLQQLRLILRAKQLGFTLPEITEILAGGQDAVREVRAAAKRKRALIMDEINQLTVVLDRLDQLVAACETGDSAQCKALQPGDPPAARSNNSWPSGKRIS